MLEAITNLAWMLLQVMAMNVRTYTQLVLHGIKLITDTHHHHIHILDHIVFKTTAMISKLSLMKEMNIL